MKGLRPELAPANLSAGDPNGSIDFLGCAGGAFPNEGKVVAINLHIQNGNESADARHSDGVTHICGSVLRLNMQGKLRHSRRYGERMGKGAFVRTFHSQEPGLFLFTFVGFLVNGLPSTGKCERGFFQFEIANNVDDARSVGKFGGFSLGNIGGAGPGRLGRGRRRYNDRCWSRRWRGMGRSRGLHLFGDWLLGSLALGGRSQGRYWLLHGNFGRGLRCNLLGRNGRRNYRLGLHRLLWRGGGPRTMKHPESHARDNDKEQRRDSH